MDKDFAYQLAFLPGFGQQGLICLLFAWEKS
jgi:hypothetical protein